jgi:uncharacterized membrane protein
MPDPKHGAVFAIGLSLFAGIFIVSGFLHLFHSNPYVRIIPPFLPWPRMLVWISGVAELAGGVGLLLRRYRRWAAYWLALLLVVVFPANIYMAVVHVPFAGLMGETWIQWLRLPLQIPLIVWALYYARPGEDEISRFPLDSTAN